MARLIDADAYIEEYQVAADIARKIGGTEMNLLADFYCEVIKEITKRPTVDAITVVRCKDCQKWFRHTEVDRERGECRRYQTTKHEAGYCDRGERKDNE